AHVVAMDLPGDPAHGRFLVDRVLEFRLGQFVIVPPLEDPLVLHQDLATVAQEIDAVVRLMDVTLDADPSPYPAFAQINTRTVALLAPLSLHRAPVTAYPAHLLIA